MNSTVQRILLTFLAVTGGVVGAWAYFAPRHWYDTFPGMGMTWLPQLGPYNEHFAKDVGAFYLGLTALSGCALVLIANTTLVRVAGAAWSVFNMLHLIVHIQMLHMYSSTDQLLNMIALGSVLVVSLTLFVPQRQRDSASR